MNIQFFSWLALTWLVPEEVLQTDSQEININLRGQREA